MTGWKRDKSYTGLTLPPWNQSSVPPATAWNALRASYDTAVSDYNEAVGKYSGNTYKATKSGYIKQLYIEAGDKVASNTQIADIYNDQIMKIKVPF